MSSCAHCILLRTLLQYLQKCKFCLKSRYLFKFINSQLLISDNSDRYLLYLSLIKSSAAAEQIRLNHIISQPWPWKQQIFPHHADMSADLFIWSKSVRQQQCINNEEYLAHVARQHVDHCFIHPLVFHHHDSLHHYSARTYSDCLLCSIFSRSTGGSVVDHCCVVTETGMRPRTTMYYLGISLLCRGKLFSQYQSLPHFISSQPNCLFLVNINNAGQSSSTESVYQLA